MIKQSVQLSIITVNLNNAKGLFNTIQSVLNQVNSNVEFIVIDGGSSDDSVHVIKKFEKEITYWISEKDSGIYQAMNKGIRQSKGNFVLFLNSGDVLAHDRVVFELFQKLDFNQDLFACGILVERINAPDLKKTPIRHFRTDTLFLESLPHQSTLIKRSLFFDYGFYEERLKIAADLEFWLRICDKKIKYNQTSYILSKMEKEGLGARMDDQHLRERFSIFMQYGRRLPFNFTSLRLLYRNRKLFTWFFKQKISSKTIELQ